MALLAGPKRKQKLGIDPNNLSWANDDSALGQSLLKKMGWKEGSGLGANEDGRVVPVKASMKIDNRGLGCTPQQADAWIAHQEEFDQILASLNSSSSKGDNGTNADDPPEDKTEGQRRFYGRFSRGGVKSLRTTEDLNCILGRRKSRKDKAIKTEENNNTGKEVEMKETDNSNCGGETESPDVDKSHGFVTVTSSCSVQDYFAQKMKNRNLPPVLQTTKSDPKDNQPTTDTLEKQTSTDSYVTSSCSVQDYFKQKMKARNARLAAAHSENVSNECGDNKDEDVCEEEGNNPGGDRFHNDECPVDDGKCEEEEETNGSKKQRKKKKSKLGEENVEDVGVSNSGDKANRKKRKRNSDEDDDVNDHNAVRLSEKEERKKKKKKLKLENEKTGEEIVEVCSIQDVKQDTGVSNSGDKTNKKKRKRNSDEDDEIDNDQMKLTENKEKKKKEKKLKLDGENTLSEGAENCPGLENKTMALKKEKSKKKKKSLDKTMASDNDENVIANDSIPSEVPDKNDKSKKHRQGKKGKKLACDLVEQVDSNQQVDEDSDIVLKSSDDHTVEKVISKKNPMYKNKQDVLDRLEMLRGLLHLKTKEWVKKLNVECRYGGNKMEDDLFRVVDERVELENTVFTLSNNKKIAKLDEEIRMFKKAAFKEAKKVKERLMVELKQVEDGILLQVKQEKKSIVLEIQELAKCGKDNNTADIDWKQEIDMLKSEKKKIRAVIKQAKDEASLDLAAKHEEYKQRIGFTVRDKIETRVSQFPGASVVKGYLC